MDYAILMVFGAMSILLFAAGCTASGSVSPQAPAASPSSVLPAPVTVSQLKTWLQPYCAGKSGSEMDNCTYTQSVNAKDVAVCTTLDDLVARNTCITTWCGSAARDFNSCYRIANNDDQLLCLSKCNPNQIK